MKMSEHIKLADWLREKQPDLLGLKFTQIADTCHLELGIDCNSGHIQRMVKDLKLDLTPMSDDSIRQLRADIAFLSGTLEDLYVRSDILCINRDKLKELANAKCQGC